MDSASWSFSEPERLSGEQLPAEVEILLSNLSALGKEAGSVDRRRNAQIGELASLISLPENASVRDTLSDFIAHLPSKGDVIRLCKALTRRGYRQMDEAFSPADPPSASASECVAYLRSRYTDAAYLTLTAHLSKPRAIYFSSFTDVCEEVYHGLCEYCILPVESATDGKLIRFYTLIEKFELKIVAVCDIEDASGTETRYALLRHRYVPLRRSSRLHGERFAEFSIVIDAGVSLTDVLNAADACGLRLSRADSAPLSYRENGYRYGLVFSLAETPGEDAPALEAFLLYLALFLPEYTPIGIYSRISE